jgi:hypothetical protein
MALACGSLQTAVTFVPSGWRIGYWPIRVDYSHAVLLPTGLAGDHSG